MEVKISAEVPVEKKINNEAKVSSPKEEKSSNESVNVSMSTLPAEKEEGVETIKKDEKPSDEDVTATEEAINLDTKSSASKKPKKNKHRKGKNKEKEMKKIKHIEATSASSTK